MSNPVPVDRRLVAARANEVKTLSFRGNGTEMAKAIGWEQSALSRALTLKTKTEGPFAELARAIAAHLPYAFDALIGSTSLLPTQENGAGGASVGGDAAPIQSQPYPVLWGGALIRSPREIADRIPVPVVEVAGGPNGMEAIDDATLRVDYYTPQQWANTFQAPIEAAGSGRYVLAHLRGESMLPRYYDRQEIPIELFGNPVVDLAGGDVFLVRLDGHLYLKLVSRRPKMGSEAARVSLRSLNRDYDPIHVPVGDNADAVDFAVLGRIVESSRDRLFAALASRAFSTFDT